MPVKNVSAADTKSYVFWITESEFDYVFDRMYELLNIRDDDLLAIFPDMHNEPKEELYKLAKAYIGASLNLMRFQLIKHASQFSITKYDEKKLNKIFDKIPPPSNIKFKILTSDVLILGLSREDAEKIKIVLNMNRNRMIKYLIYQTIMAYIPSLAERINDYDATFNQINKEIKMKRRPTWTKK